MIKHRRIDIVKDRQTLLEFHCEINYECESDFTKEIPYEVYREKWRKTEKQVEEFISALSKSLEDSRTIADILEDENGTVLGYLWVSFCEIKDYNLLIAEINEVAVAKQFRKSGIGTYAIEYVEKFAKSRGANILRSGTGYGNLHSKVLHERCGFKPYRIEYEKVL